MKPAPPAAPVEPGPASAHREPVAVDVPSRLANVAIIIVTWNRKEMVSAVLDALSKQRYPLEQIDVTVVDNHSTDGTADLLIERWRPERVVDNPTDQAHRPGFSVHDRDATNAIGVRSLNIVRNAHNHGGCGGFNTGFAFVDQVLRKAPEDDRPEYVWLVDDDIDLPSDAARRLVEAAEADDAIGLVGSRTCDINDRTRTIETTVYVDRETGMMGDEPAQGHPLRAAHEQWAKEVGGPKGGEGYAGLREVDVVSACSLLARWSAVEKVGFWDWRYFIYCDDADWCLRFAREGYRVVLNLDAVVYHTPWHHKLTPARLYYAQRNAIWMMQKVLTGRELNRVTFRRLASLMRDSLRAMSNRRLFHAEIMRRTADDVCTQGTGKLDYASPAQEPVGEAFGDRGLVAKDKTVAVLINRPEAFAWSRGLQDTLRSSLPAGAGMPRWVEIVRNDMPDADRPVPGEPERVVYSHRRRSKLRRQFGLNADALVIFDQVADFPMLGRAWNVHIDTRDPAKAQFEWGGLRARAAFMARWFITGVRCVLYAARVKPYKPADRYG